MFSSSYFSYYSYFSFTRISGADNCGIKAKYDNHLKEVCTSPSLPPPEPYLYSDYCWKPIGCDSERFSVSDFCRRLNGRGILMVGDSIQHQFYDALFMQLGEEGQPLGQWTVVDHITTKEAGGICKDKGGGRLVYLRNDQMAVTDTTPLNRPHKNVFRANWTSVAHLFEIIILNKGAHYIEKEDQFIRETVETARWLKENIDFNKTQIFYRETPQGHPDATRNISADTTPVESPLIFPSFKTYNWGEFPKRNKLVIDLFQSILGPYFSILYVENMTTRRPDGHRGDVCGGIDNLHYFLPSVIDSWVQVCKN